MGRPAARPRQPDIRRPSGPLRHRADSIQPRREPTASRDRRPRARGVGHPGLRTREAALGGVDQRLHTNRRGRGGCREHDDLERVPDSSVLHRRRGRDRRVAAAQVPLSRPAPPPNAGHAHHAPQRSEIHPRLPQRQRIPGHRDSNPHQKHPRRRARLPRSEPSLPRKVLLPTAVAATVEAAAHGSRGRAVLPNGKVLSGRGSAGGPTAGIYPARPRNELRR